MIKVIIEFVFILLPIRVLRFLFDSWGNFSGPASLTLSEIKDINISSYIKARIYKPSSTTPNPLPIIVYYYGGGWILGSIKAYDQIFQYLCSQSGCILVAIEYRKAPEFRYPCAIEDAVLGYKWMISKIKWLGGDKNKIILAGDSAGGNLALSVLQFSLKNYKIQPKLQILIYPIVAVNQEVLASIRNDKNLFIRTLGYFFLNYCLKQYINIQKDQKPPSSINYKIDNSRCKYFPNTLIIAAGLDPLNNSINQFIKKIKRVGHNISRKTCPGTIHGFINFARFNKSAIHALDVISSFIRNNINEK